MRKQYVTQIVGVAVAMAAYAQSPSFDVVSVKPNRSGARNSGYRRAGPGILNATNVTLKMLVEYAYDVRDYQISGGPNWFDSERYDVLAKPAPGADSGSSTAAGQKALLRLRVQALLSDRFQLALHQSTKELPTFALVLAKNGPRQLKEPDGSPTDLISNGHHLTCQKVSMDMLARVFLQGELGRPVSNQTGVKGEFNFTLDWVAERKPPAEGREETALPEGPSLFTALQEQLGLRLEPRKGPVEILVIDRAERASEN